MTSQNVTICTNCVMDSSDPEITFDENGVCNHCRLFLDVKTKKWHPNEAGRKILRSKIDEIKLAGKGKEYDCILGLSGGVDSSYLAVKLKEEFDLKPLVFHVDAGWNSELAVHNIERIVKHCGYELFTEVINWEEMRDLQIAYLKSGVANQDVPQDHIFFSTLYRYATKNNIKHVITGSNISTEGIFPDAWHHSAMDAWNLKDIHKKFGSIPLKEYRTISPLQYYIFYPFIYKMRVVRPLDFMPYTKNQAIEYLKQTIGYKPYSGKHGESRFTKLFQDYFLPVRFGYDKRKPHLASLVVTGQLSRDEALTLLEESAYDPKDIEGEIDYFCKKIRITREEFDGFISQRKVAYTEYKNWDKFYKLVKFAQNGVERLTGKRIKNYS